MRWSKVKVCRTISASLDLWWILFVWLCSLCLLATERKNYWTGGGSRIFEEGPKASEEASFFLLLSFPFLSFSIFFLSLTPPIFILPWPLTALPKFSSVLNGSVAPGSGSRIFSSTLRFLKGFFNICRAFFRAWLISPQLQRERIFMKILSQMYPWTTKPPDFSGRTYAVSDCSQQVQQIQKLHQ